MRKILFWEKLFEKSFLARLEKPFFQNKFFQFCLLFLIALSCAVPAFGYVLERTNSGAVLRWDLTRSDDKVQNGQVQYYLNADCSSDFADVNQCLNMLRNSFAHWGDIPTSLIDFNEAGTTSATQAGNDNINLIVFVTGDPELSGGTIALTTTFFNPITGEIIDSDIRFNDGEYNFAGDTSLEAVATHEIGHFFGLDHSFLGYIGPAFEETVAATMFPYYFGVEAITLQWDDKAGASELYPEALLFANYGIMSGKVTEGTEAGTNILGSHISLLNVASGAPVVAGVTGKDGTYQIYGCPQGTYVVLAEPPPLDPAHWGPYYASAPTDYNPILYDGHEFTDFTEAMPGSDTFDSAERVSITAQNETSGINFVVNPIPPPPPSPPSSSSSGGGDGSGGLFGCSASTGVISFDFSWFLLVVPYLIRVCYRRKGGKIL